MCVDCVLASSRIAQVDPGDEPLPEVVLSQFPTTSMLRILRVEVPHMEGIDCFLLSIVSS
jgi:hypothetical protein